MKVEDLDILRPQPKFFRIGGKDVDVSFIPCGITFEIDRIVNGLNKFVNLDSDESIKEAFRLTVELCVAFCSWKNPELDYEWFQANTSAAQVKLLADGIKDALTKAYATGGQVAQPKKGQAVKK